METAVYRAMGSLHDPKYAARLERERATRRHRESSQPATPWWERIPAGFGSMVTTDETVN